MDNEVREITGVTKSTVDARLKLPKQLHRKAMKIHGLNPRTMTFADTLVDLIAFAVAEKAKKKETQQ